MGIIKAFTSAIGGGLSDQWLEVIESDNMTDSTVLTQGVVVRKNDKRNRNLKGTSDTLSNGSIIHVGEKEVMLLVDGGKIVDYSAEPGYFQVDNSSLPSLFNGEFGQSLKETFQRFKFSGVTPYKQQVFYINTQEIKGIKFGTRNPIRYWDNFYNAELSIRAHGTYSIEIINPLLFYQDQISRNAKRVDINDINTQYQDEFLQAFSAALNQLSIDGIRVSHLQSQGPKLANYMSHALDEGWGTNRGLEIRSVGIGGISYTEDSQALIDKINMGMAFSDPTRREAYLQTEYIGGLSKGLEGAGSNKGGSGQAFMGLGLGMNVGNMGMSGGVGSFSETNRQQMNAHKEKSQEEIEKLEKEKIEDSWTCPQCHFENVGNFCINCGHKKPEEVENIFICSNCDYEIKGANAPKFCPNCGKPFVDKK